MPVVTSRLQGQNTEIAQSLPTENDAVQLTALPVLRTSISTIVFVNCPVLNCHCVYKYNICLNVLCDVRN